MTYKRTAISTRRSAPADRELAESYGIRLIDYPARDYRYIMPPNRICESVISRPLPDAWIFSSRRGVEGWWKVWSSPPLSLAGDSPPLTRDGAPYQLPLVYAVGDKTQQILKETFGPEEIRKSPEENGETLAKRMAADGIEKVVHFCGTERRTEIREVCRKHNVQLIEVEVYESFPVTDPEPVTETADAILFFSPNGVSGFCQLYGLPAGDWTAIAIGPTTAEAVRHETGREPRVAPVPSFREMIKLAT